MGLPSIGELEHLILLAILNLRDRASALEIRQTLVETANRSISRGALYRSLDRLGEKGLVDWETHEPSPERGGHTKRIYGLSEVGMKAVRERRAALQRLWDGAPGALEG